MKKVKQIIFLNTKDEAERYLDSDSKNISTDSMIIAMSPSVYVAAKKRGLEVHNTLPYLSSNSQSTTATATIQHTFKCFMVKKRFHTPKQLQALPYSITLIFSSSETSKSNKT